MILKKNNFVLELPGLSKEYLKINMIWIPPGTFLMGEDKDDCYYSDEDDEHIIPHNSEAFMTLSQGYWLADILTTQAYWEHLNIIPLSKVFDRCRNMGIGFVLKEDSPIYNVTWLEAIQFCQKLNQLFKSSLPLNYHFSLPTEMQWEYACKAGINEVVKHYNQHSCDDDVIIKKTRNDFGLYDMLGFRQWCYDIMSIVEEKDDWLGNKQEEFWTLDSFQFKGERTRIVRGVWKSSFREYEEVTLKLLGMKQIGFRIALRPIVNEKNCDLDDPLLKKENINILGD